MAFSKMSRPKRYLSLTIGAVFTVFSLLLTSTAVANILPSGGETWVYIFYNSDDTSQNPLATFHVPSGDKLPDPGLPKTYPTGKYFDKWVECGSSTEIVPGSNTASGSGVKKACPVFTETLVITYISEGSVYETAKVTDFSSYQPPFNPVLKIIPDRQFMYWSVDNPDTTPNPARFDFSTLGSGGTNGHLRLFAIPEDRYTLVFDTTPPNSSDRCPTIKPMYIRGDRTLDQEGIRNKTNNPPTCPGYTFLHWVDPNNGSTQVTASTQTAASIDQNGDKKIILKAAWQPQEVTYYIRVFTQKPGSANDTVGTTPIDDYEFRDTWKMLGQAGTIFNAADDVKFAKNIDVSVTAPDENAIGQFDAKVSYEGFKFCNTPADAAADDQDTPDNTKCKSSTVNRNVASTGTINADGKSVFDIYLDRKVYKAQVYNRQYSSFPWSPLNSGNEYKLLRYGQPSDAFFAYLNTTYPGYRYYRDTSLNSYYTSPFVMPNNDVRMYRVWGNNATFQLRFYEWDASKWDADNPSAINTMLPKVNPDPANPSIRTSASFTSGQCTYMADKTGAGSCQTGNQWVDSTDHVDIEGFTQVQHDKITYDTYTGGAQAVDVNTDSTNPRWRDYMLGGQSNPNFQSTAQCREPIGSYNWICDPGSGGVSDSTHAYIGFMFYNRNAYDVRYVSKRETVATQHYLYQENLKSVGTVNTVNKAITDGATGTSYPASPQKIGEPSVSAATLKATKCTRGTSELTGNFVLQDGDICEFSGVEEIFKGWWRDPNHNQKPQYVTDTDVTMPASNTNLYAKWEKPANSIRVYQDEVRNRGDETTAKYTNIESISDGSFVEGSASELTVRVGDKTVTAHPPANASQFLGWYWIATKKDEQGETTEEMAEYVFGSSGFKIFDSNVLDGNIHDTLDVVLYPRWKYKQLKVVYDMNGGENPPVDKASPYDYLANAKTLIVPLASTSAAKQTTSGVDDLFLGWSPNQNCATTTGCTPIEPGTLENLVPNNGSTDTMTLFAVWKAPEIQTTSLTYHRNCNIADNTSYEKTNLGIRVDIDVMQNDKDDTSGDKTTFSCQSDGQELLFKCWVQDRSATSCDSGFNKDGTQSTIMLDTADETAKNHLYALWAPAVVTHDATTYAMQGQVQLSTDKVNDSAGNDQGLSATEMFSASGGNLPLNFTGATFGLHDPTDTSDPTSTITGELIVGGVATDNTPVAEAGRYSINTSTGVVTFTPNPGFVGNPTPATIVATIDGQQYTARYQPIVKPYNTVGITTTDEQKVTQRSTDKETGDHGMTAAEAFPGVELSGASYWLVDPADSTHKQNVTISGKGTYSVDSSGVVTFTPVDTFTGTSEAITLGVTTTASVDFTTTYTPTVTPVTTSPATSENAPGVTQHSNDSGAGGKTPAQMFSGTDLTSANFWLVDPSDSVHKTSVSVDEGTYTIGADGIVTFTPNPNFTSGTATPVTVGVTNQKGVDWTATYTPKVSPSTEVETKDAVTVGMQGEVQNSNDTGTNPGGTNNGVTPAQMFQSKTPIPLDLSAATFKLKDTDGNLLDSLTPKDSFGNPQGTYTIAGDGVVTFNPVPGFVGTPIPAIVSAAIPGKGTYEAFYRPQVKPYVPQTITTVDEQGITQHSTDNGSGDNGKSAAGAFPDVPLSGATFWLEDPDTHAHTTTVTVPGVGTYSVADTGVVTFVPESNFVGTHTGGVTFGVTTTGGVEVKTTYTPTVTSTTPPPTPPGPPSVTPKAITTTDEQGATQHSTDKETGDHGLTAAEAFPGADLGATPSYWLVKPGDDPNDNSKRVLSVTVPGVGDYSINPTTGEVSFTPERGYVTTPATPAVPVTVGLTTTAGNSYNTTYTPTVTPVTTVNATTIGVQGDAQHSNDKNSGDNGKTPSEMFVGTDLSNAIFWLETDGTRTKTVPGEGTYTVDPATGVVTFEPEPDFTGSARGVTVGVTTRKHTEWKATYIPTVNPTTPATVPATTVGNQGETQHSNDKGSGDNGKTPEEMFPGADLDSDPDAVRYWIDNPGTTEKTVPNVGTFEVDPSTGVVTFIPEDDYIGSTTPVTVGVSDSNGTPFTSTYQPTVNPVAPPPGPPSPGGGSGTPNIPSWTVPTPNPNVSPTPTPTPSPNGEPAPGDSVDPSVPSVPGSTPKRPIDGDHGAVGELAWHDMNGDGNRDPGEPLLPGVIVQLIDENNRVVSETITGNNGEYIFNAVNPGKYYVLFKAPPGFNFTKYGYDSKADNLGRTEWFEVMRGQYYNLANAGLMNFGLAKTGFNATRFGWLALTFGGLGMLLLAAASRRRESESILIK